VPKKMWTLPHLSPSLSPEEAGVPQAKRTAADAYLARFGGPRWTVAMRGRDWDQFCNLPDPAKLRLTAVLEHFCTFGEANIPRSTFAWMTPATAGPTGVVSGSFEA